MKKRLTAFTSLLMALWLSTAFLVTPTEVSAAFQTSVDVHCDTAYMYDMETGLCVYEKDSDKKKLPASLTKMMACIVAYETAGSMDERVAIDQRAIKFVNYNTEGVTGMWTNFKADEEVSLRDLIYAALVGSENCAAEALGYYITEQYLGGEANSEFIDLMNERAGKIGCTNTKFKCASGLTNDFENHYSTAHDMAVIAGYLMDIPELAEIAYTPTSYGIAPTNKHENIQWFVSTNQLIRKNSKAKDGTQYYYKYCKGVKTGYLDASGHCYASYAVKNSRRYICVLMDDGASSAGDTNMAFVDAKELFEWAFNELMPVNIYNASDPIAEVPLTLAWNKDTLTLFPQEDFNTVLPSYVDEKSKEKVVDESKIRKIVKTDDSIIAPVKKGDVYGSVELTYDGEHIGTVKLVAGESVERSSALYLLSIISAFFTSIFFKVILAVVVLAGGGYMWYRCNFKKGLSNAVKRKKRSANGSGAKPSKGKRPTPKASTKGTSAKRTPVKNPTKR